MKHLAGRGHIKSGFQDSTGTLGWQYKLSSSPEPAHHLVQLSDSQQIIAFISDSTSSAFTTCKTASRLSIASRLSTAIYVSLSIDFL